MGEEGRGLEAKKDGRMQAGNTAGECGRYVNERRVVICLGFSWLWWEECI